MLAVLSSLVILGGLSFSAQAATVCNGQAKYCSEIWSNVSQVGSHDSAFVGDLPTQNQHWSVTDQLNNGIRFLQGQTHKNVLGTLDMCHTSCWEEDAGSTENYMSTVKSWLDANPNEVVTMLLTNGDNVDPSLFDSAMSASGLKSYAFVPSTGAGVLGINDWPTYGEMIDAGTRLVFFLGKSETFPFLRQEELTNLDYGANTAQYPQILDEFSYFFETPFDTTDPTFPECTLDRPAGASPSGRMYIVNHFLDQDVLGIDIPDESAAGTTNAATGSGSIGAQVGLCQSTYGYAPKGVLLDYVDMGTPLAAELAMNGLS
jgi:hypothetical protein